MLVFISLHYWNVSIYVLEYYFDTLCLGVGVDYPKKLDSLKIRPDTLV